MDRIDLDENEIRVCYEWHGGQASMLYAAASTGALMRGTVRPRVDCDECGSRGSVGFGRDYRPCPACRGAKMTDEQWLAHLAERLAEDAEETAEHAREDDLDDDASILDGLALKCRRAVETLKAR